MLPEPSPRPSPHVPVSVELSASALLVSLHDFAAAARASTSEPALRDLCDPRVQHARETQRLVALLTTHLSASVSPHLAEPESGALTRREVEVLTALADGLSTIEIAALLHISVNTARNHVQRILEKLGVHSRLQAVNAGMRFGLLQRRAG